MEQANVLANKVFIFNYIASVGHELNYEFKNINTPLAIVDSRGKALSELIRGVQSDFEKKDVKDIIDFSLALNWASWGAHALGDQEDLTEEYAEKWHKFNNYCYRHLKGEDLSRYLREID